MPPRNRFLVSAETVAEHKWPRLDELPAGEREEFLAWLGEAARPDTGGFFPWDYEEWKDGTPGPWV